MGLRVLPVCRGSLLHKVWSRDPLCQRHLGACQKRRISGSTIDLLSQKQGSLGSLIYIDVWETLA